MNHDACYTNQRFSGEELHNTHLLFSTESIRNLHNNVQN